VARFRQINLENACEHHDALEFPRGQVVLLTPRYCSYRPARSRQTGRTTQRSPRRFGGIRSSSNRTGPRLKNGALRAPAPHDHQRQLKRIPLILKHSLRA
jgi:hypothetical protein